MIVNLENIRAVVRPYAAKLIELPELLDMLWPVLLDADDDSNELAASIGDLLALHAARVIDEVALRQRLIHCVFDPGEIILGEICVSEVQSDNEGSLIANLQTGSEWSMAELISA